MPRPSEIQIFLVTLKSRDELTKPRQAKNFPNLATSNIFTSRS